jgi:hypothetical protein
VPSLGIDREALSYPPARHDRAACLDVLRADRGGKAAEIREVRDAKDRKRRTRTPGDQFFYT